MCASASSGGKVMREPCHDLGTAGAGCCPPAKGSRKAMPTVCRSMDFQQWHLSHVNGAVRSR